MTLIIAWKCFWKMITSIINYALNLYTSINYCYNHTHTFIMFHVYSHIMASGLNNHHNLHIINYIDKTKVLYKRIYYYWSFQSKLRGWNLLQVFFCIWVNLAVDVEHTRCLSRGLSSIWNLICLDIYLWIPTTTPNPTSLLHIYFLNSHFLIKTLRIINLSQQVVLE